MKTNGNPCAAFRNDFSLSIFSFSPFVITEINLHTGLGGQPSAPVRLSGPSYQSSQL